MSPTQTTDEVFTSSAGLMLIAFELIPADSTLVAKAEACEKVEGNPRAGYACWACQSAVLCDVDVGGVVHAGRAVVECWLFRLCGFDFVLVSLGGPRSMVGTRDVIRTFVKSPA